MGDVKVKWDHIVNQYPNSIPVCNWIDLGNGTMFLISAFNTYKSIGMARDGIMIAIDRVGSFLFPQDSELKFGYVSEKLFIPESDARAMADWLNVQIKQYKKQQGIYSRTYLDYTEEYYQGSKIIRPIIEKEIA